MNVIGCYRTTRNAPGRAPRALLCVIVLGAVCGYSYGFEIESRAPGSEIERFERECRDDQNREASERCDRESEPSSQDRERATEYERDHGA